MRNPLTGWSLPLRLARREARRAPARSLLVLTMIALPVAAVTVADTMYATQDLSGAEAVERRLGGADARVELVRGGASVAQEADPDDGSSYGGGRRTHTATIQDVQRVLGTPEAPGVPLVTGEVRFATDEGIGRAEVIETDLTDPLTAGIVELTEGRWPAAGDEVVVNADLAARGPGLGEELEVVGAEPLRIVGIAESTSYSGNPYAAGPVGAFDIARPYTEQWLIGGGPVTWDDVLALNRIGALVHSRAVLTDPPPTSALAPEMQFSQGVEKATLTVLALVVVMVLIEVVLLAGPAFAVGARRQSRTLALIAAAGGTPRQARRVVLASGVVLGLFGAVSGVALGLAAAAALMPVFQSFSNTRFGPFDVSWTHLAAVAAFGLLSALLAAAVPAWIASRQDVVAVLGGRRGDARPSRRSPVLGVVLVGLAVGGAAYGARGGGGEATIAAAAIASVLGMVFLVPVIVAAVARLARRLPLPLRFAARDAARHRTRTVPAVAAVAATVAGVVALGIAVTSDEEESEQTYYASIAMGHGLVSDYRRQAPWDAYQQAVSAVLHDAQVTRLRGLDLEADRGSREVEIRSPDAERVLSSYGGPLRSSVLVATEMPPGLPGIDDADRVRADETLDAGGLVAFADQDIAADEAHLRAVTYTRRSVADPVRLTAPATYLTVEDGYAIVQAVVSPEVAERLGGVVTTTGLIVDGPISAEEENDVNEAVGAIGAQGSFQVERGYRAPDETVIIQLVLAGLGAVLMLGGTLTATFLALSDARADLATLSAVGAAPRTRRSVAASYALVVGLVGAVLGALVGAIPGIAITYPLTGAYGPPGAPDHYLDVPWVLVLAVVVGLPVLTALLVGLTARSRLPLVARLE